MAQKRQRQNHPLYLPEVPHDVIPIEGTSFQNIKKALYLSLASTIPQKLAGKVENIIHRSFSKNLMDIDMIETNSPIGSIEMWMAEALKDVGKNYRLAVIETGKPPRLVCSRKSESHLKPGETVVNVKHATFPQSNLHWDAVRVLDRTEPELLALSSGADSESEDFDDDSEPEITGGEYIVEESDEESADDDISPQENFKARANTNMGRDSGVAWRRGGAASRDEKAMGGVVAQLEGLIAQKRRLQERKATPYVRLPQRGVQLFDRFLNEGGRDGLAGNRNRSKDARGREGEVVGEYGGSLPGEEFWGRIREHGGYGGEKGKGKEIDRGGGGGKGKGKEIDREGGWGGERRSESDEEEDRESDKGDDRERDEGEGEKSDDEDEGAGDILEELEGISLPEFMNFDCPDIDNPPDPLRIRSWAGYDLSHLNTTPGVSNEYRPGDRALDSGESSKGKEQEQKGKETRNDKKNDKGGGKGGRKGKEKDTGNEKENATNGSQTGRVTRSRNKKNQGGADREEGEVQPPQRKQNTRKPRKAKGAGVQNKTRNPGASEMDVPIPDTTVDTLTREASTGSNVELADNNPPVAGPARRRQPKFRNNVERYPHRVKKQYRKERRTPIKKATSLQPGRHYAQNDERLYLLKPSKRVTNAGNDSDRSSST